MRLQLRAWAVVGLAWLALASPSAVAGGGASLRTDVYSDEWIVVVSPAAAANVDLGRRVLLDAGVAVDVLSGATQVFTTDVVTSATEFREVRRGVRFRTEVELRPTWRLDGAYALSIEPDHETHTGTVGTEVELFDRMGTLAASYGLWFERVGRAGDPTYRQDTLGQRVDLSWTQILARRSVLTVASTTQWTTCDARLGCQANPYRMVGLVDPDHTRVLTVVPERHPHRRLRQAASVRFVQGLPHGLALQGGYRGYVDTWKIHAHAGDLGLSKAFFGERLVTRAEARFSWQQQASFYRDAYEQDPGALGVPQFRSGDRELARMFNVSGTLRAEVNLPPLGPLQLRVSARGGYIHFRYLTFRELPTRNAWLAGAGLAGTF